MNKKKKVTTAVALICAKNAGWESDTAAALEAYPSGEGLDHDVNLTIRIAQNGQISDKDLEEVREIFKTVLAFVQGLADAKWQGLLDFPPSPSYCIPEY